MNVMRNSGFELGNEDFWANEGFALFNTTDADPMYGTYSAALFTSAAASQYLRNVDLIEVNAGDAVLLSCYCKGATGGYINQRMRCYTIDGEYIGYVGGSRYVSSADYTHYQDALIAPPRASYVSYELLYKSAGAAVDVYVDVCALQVNPTYNPAFIDGSLADLSGVDVAGDTKSYFKYLYFGKDYFAYLDFDAKAGHTADATIKVVERADVGDWVTLGTFAVTAIDAVEKIVLSNATGRQMAIEYTFGAGVINCDIEVSVVGKR